MSVTRPIDVGQRQLQNCKLELCGAGFQPADPLSSGSSRLERRLRPRLAAPQKGTDRILQLPLASAPLPERVFMKCSLLLLVGGLCLHAQNYTLGIGVYPGDPRENFAPSMRVDATTYRNLALHRPVYQSSSYDYNLTAQLLTDGIRERALPQYVVTSTSSGGILNKQQREAFLDGNITSSVDVTGDHPWVEFDLEGGADPPELDRIDLWLRR